MPRGSFSPRSRNATGSMPGRRRQLVDEALDRKAIGRLAGRADRRRPQRRVLQPMRDDLDAVRRIGRIGVLRDQPGTEPRTSVDAGGLGPSSGIFGQSLRSSSAATSRCANRGCGRRRRPRRKCRAAAAGLWDRSRARPRATIAPAPGGRSRAIGSRRRPPRPRGRSCRSSRSLRDRSAAPSRAACRGIARRWRDCHACPARRSISSPRRRAHRRPRRTDRSSRGFASASNSWRPAAWRLAARGAAPASPLVTSASSVMPGAARRVAASLSCAGRPDALAPLRAQARGRRARLSIRRRRRRRGNS